MSRPRVLTLLALLALVVAALWLRSPGMGFAVWNLDEAIHSAAAQTLLEGGVLYRDAIDQRTPLTYYLVAAVYAIAGVNNLHALHVVVALLVAATALNLLLAARAWGRAGAGAWAAGLYVALSTCVLYEGDANAFNTEWALAFFTSLAAAFFAGGGARPATGRLLATGAALGLAFLSKQPALLDAAVPVIGLAWFAWRRPEERRGLAWRVALVASGFLAPVLAAAAYFAAHGALRDAVYYTWTYNLTVYGPEISPTERLSALLHFWRMILAGAPLVLVALLAALPLAARQLAQRSPDAREQRDEPLLLYTVAWSVTAVGAAMSSGRSFDHYLIQALPPLCLVAGWLLARIGGVALAPHRHALPRLAATLAVLAVAFTVADSARRARSRTLPTDVSFRVAPVVREHSAPGDRIFVWGFHPEFHLFTDRAPASRFLYGSFLTGLVPWTNVAPERDTAYAIVPGAMDTLLADLERARPVFIIDCSAGPNRHWQKYPLARFPALRGFVDRHYVRFEPEHLRGLGFDLYLLRDDARPQPVTLDGAGPVQLDPPAWTGPEITAPRPALYTVQGHSPDSRLRRLEFLLNGEVVAGATFAASEWARYSARLPLDRLGFGRHTVQVRAWGADGSGRDGASRTVEVTDNLLAPERLAGFGLDRLVAPILPTSIEAPYGADADLSEGRRDYHLHAPSTLAYTLPANASVLRGGFGLRPGAYEDNPTPSDGAEFLIELVGADGASRVLFQRLLDPRQRAEDRGLQRFALILPSDLAAGTQVRLVITAGPSGSPASDWTYWSDLRLETSR